MSSDMTKATPLSTWAWLAGGLCIGLSLIGWLFSSHSVAPVPNAEHAGSQTVSFDSPLNQLDSQSYLVTQTQNQLNQALLQSRANASHVTELQSALKDKDQALTSENAKIAELATQMTRLQAELNTSTPSTAGVNGALAETSGIQDDHLSLKSNPSDAVLIPTQNPDTYVPSGTYVKAVMLGGADASAGVSSQGNPSPTLFRLLDNGTLPNKAKSHLKGCFATAAAIGDISSERGEIRLEHVSCTRQDGSILDVPVEATVFGYDGKNGVRGLPLWREGALLQRAFAAGIFSGIGNGIAQSYTNTALSPIGAVQSVDGSHILQYGLASGVGNAAEKLADYNIQRAEQYHPVIQVSAGQIVDIVFLKGFYLDGQSHDNDNTAKTPYVAISETNSPLTALLQQANPQNSTEGTLAGNTTATGNQAASQMKSAPSSPPPLPLTPEEISRLQHMNQQGGAS